MLLTALEFLLTISREDTKKRKIQVLLETIVFSLASLGTIFMNSDRNGES